MAIDVSELPTLDARATASYAHLFQALSEPTRLAVVQHLASGEHRVRDLVEHMGLAQSTVSKHLSFLVECDLIQARPEGRATWYSLTRPHELAALIAAAEHILHTTGTDAVLCAHLRHPPRPPATEAETGSDVPAGRPGNETRTGVLTDRPGIGASPVLSTDRPGAGRPLPGTSPTVSAATPGGAASSSGRETE